MILYNDVWSRRYLKCVILNCVWKMLFGACHSKDLPYNEIEGAYDI